MTTSKVAISIPSDVLALAKRKVRAGRAKSLSAFVSEAVGEKLQREDLAEVLAAMEKEHGKPNAEAKKWAKQVLLRSSSMRAR